MFLMDKIISVCVVLLTIVGFFFISYSMAPKYHKIHVMVYYQCQPSEVLVINARGKIKMDNGCIKDEDGTDFVCGVIRYQII